MNANVAILFLNDCNNKKRLAVVITHFTFFGEWAANHEKGCYFFFCKKATLLIISSPRTSDDTPSFYVAVSLVYVQTKHGLLSTFGALPRCLLVQQALRCDGALLYTTSLAMIKVCTEEECSVVNPQDE